MKIAIIYIRTSTQEQNPKNQLKDCLFINNYGKYELFEEKQSAFKDINRIEFEKIRTLIKQNKVEHLIVWDLDRLFRNRKKLIEFFEFCKIYKCKIHSFRQDWLEQLHKMPEPFNEIMFNLMLQIMGWLAEEESKKKSERVKIAYQNRKGAWGRKSLSKNVIKEVLDLSKKDISIRKISQSVFYWDKNKNKKNVSPSVVHKIIKENTTKN